ncbi:MAG: FAD-binding protein [Methylovirgula sp.]|uniref:FAD-binding protein n=1 Tax=Methylovirgula sp. TaxID=1978224 RepID=UPI0030764F0F
MAATTWDMGFAPEDDCDLTLSTDVLVIGGGPAAAWAAWSAATSGAKVVVVDKGYLGSSGAAAASGNGVLTVPPAERPEVLIQRYRQGNGLGNPRWIERVLECTWQSMPLLDEWGYKFPRENGEPARKSFYGPEYMRVIRRRLLALGVRILDQSPALELLVDRDGVVAGARGLQRQENRRYSVRAGAVVLATGGCSFLSNALGCNVNTGDASLMAVEAGAELSSMEFSAQYAISSAVNATATRGVPYAWATYTDADGNDLGGIEGGRRRDDFLATALLKGPVFARLDKATPDIRAVIEKSHFIAFLPLRKAGIDPYTQRFPVTLVLEGTVRGVGGVRLTSDDCAASVPGLYAAGDAATREFLAGAASGGGGPNAAWAISSGRWAGAGAARFALALRSDASDRPLRATGQVGLRPAEGKQKFDSDAIIKGVQDELFPLDKNYFRTGVGLITSLQKLDSLWREVRCTPRVDDPRSIERSRTAAALVAAGRWTYRAGLERRETRSLNRRTDFPHTDPAQRHYQVTGGLDEIWIRREPVENIPDYSHSAVA